jgi:uncharacterized membrane protein YdbT with pleckstrin-like domain
MVDLASLQQQPIPQQPEPSPTHPVQQQSDVQQPATEDVPLEMGTTTFAKDNLTAGETILHAGRFHPLFLNAARNILVSVFLSTSILLIIVFILGHDDSRPPSSQRIQRLFVLLSLLGCFYIFPFFCVLYGWAHNTVKKTEFVLTTNRLVMKWGLLRTVSREIQLEKIESVDYGQIIIERWFNVGRLVIRGTGGGKIKTFRYLLDALEFRRRILAQIDRMKT